MVRREQKHQLLRNFELALYSERIQRLKKEKKSLVTTARNIYRAAGATLRSTVVVLLGFSLVIGSYGCNVHEIHQPMCNYIVEVHSLNNQKDTVSYCANCDHYPYIITHDHSSDLCINNWDCMATGVKGFKILSKNTILSK